MGLVTYLGHQQLVSGQAGSMEPRSLLTGSVTRRAPCGQEEGNGELNTEFRKAGAQSLSKRSRQSGWRTRHAPTIKSLWPEGSPLSPGLPAANIPATDSAHRDPDPGLGRSELSVVLNAAFLPTPTRPPWPSSWVSTGLQSLPCLAIYTQDSVFSPGSYLTSS